MPLASSRRLRNSSRRRAGRATGPTTVAGKARSAKNALVHGATSPQLLDDAERTRYAQLLTALQMHYPTPHPLVQLQLERIARLAVQLERIQGVMDAAFIVERRSQSAFERACTALHLSDDEQAHLLVTRIARLQGRAPPASAEAQLMAAVGEIRAVGDPALLTTHQQFLTIVPKVCRYLVEQARWHKLTLSEYLLTRQADPAQSARVAAAANRDELAAAPDVKPTGGAVDDDIAAAVLEVAPEILQRAVMWFSQHRRALFNAQTREQQLEALTEAVQAASVPELDKLDRLMRYQTTINRQLSTAIGELLELTRRSERPAATPGR